MGRILSWSAALRDKPYKNVRGTYQGILADLPRDARVTVVSRDGGWLNIEAVRGDRMLKGYVSQELIEYVSPGAFRHTDGEATGKPPHGAAKEKALRYEVALALSDWPGAAKLLNDFSDSDTAALLKKLKASELAYMVQGACLSMPTWQHLRITRTIARLHPFAVAVGTRLAAARKKLEAVQTEFHVDIIPREAWGALPPDKSRGWHEYPQNAPLPLERVVVHHTADPLGQTVKELQGKGLKAGYADLPYHFVITADGKIHEGRVMDVVGAHAGEFAGNKDIRKDPDYGAIGIVLTGDFESRPENFWRPDKPTAQQLENLQRLLNHLVRQYALNPANILKHSEVKRSGKPKVCPGEHLSPHVERSRRMTQRALEELAAADENIRAIEKEVARLK